MARKGLTGTKKRRYTAQQPGTKSARGPADKPRINCGSTANFVYIGFRLFVLMERRSGNASSMPWWVRGTLVSLVINSVGTLSYQTPPRRPPGAPTRTARDMPGFLIRQVLFVSTFDAQHVRESASSLCSWALKLNTHSFLFIESNLSNPKTGETTGGSVQAQRGGGAEPGRTGRRQNSMPRKQAFLVPCKGWKTRFLNVLPEARKNTNRFKPNAGTKSVFDHRFVSCL